MGNPIILFSFFSCKKEEKFVPTPEYLSVVGEWKAIEVPDNIILSIEKNGLIHIDRNAQRGFSIQTDRIEFKEDNTIIDGSLWDRLWCTDFSNDIPNSIVIYLSNNKDTLSCKTGSIDGINGTNSSKFTRK